MIWQSRLAACCSKRDRRRWSTVTVEKFPISLIDRVVSCEDRWEDAALIDVELAFPIIRALGPLECLRSNPFPTPLSGVDSSVCRSSCRDDSCASRTSSLSGQGCDRGTYPARGRRSRSLESSIRWRSWCRGGSRVWQGWAALA